MDREKVIKGLHCCSHTDGINCVYCPYDNTDEDCTALMSMDVLALLKEQDELLHKKQKDIDRLCNEISEWKHKYHEKSLKEQEAVKPIYNEEKYEDHLPHCGNCEKVLPNNAVYGKVNFCHYCGREVKWE